MTAPSTNLFRIKYTNFRSVDGDPFSEPGPVIDGFITHHTFEDAVAYVHKHVGNLVSIKVITDLKKRCVVPSDQERSR